MLHLSEIDRFIYLKISVLVLPTTNLIYQTKNILYIDDILEQKYYDVNLLKICIWMAETLLKALCYCQMK